jgi:hypothetical protein
MEFVEGKHCQTAVWGMKQIYTIYVGNFGLAINQQGKMMITGKVQTLQHVLHPV